MNRAFADALGLTPEVWLFLSLLGCVTLFFKFSRFWSVRNLDLLLLFALVPGMLLIGGDPERHIWAAYIWLFLGSGLWLFRCFIDLGLSRRPLLEPNLNSAGLLCLSIGLLGLMLAETVSLPVEDGVARNPAEPSGRENRSPTETGPENPALDRFKKLMPIPSSLKKERSQVIVQRVLASLAHLGLVVGLLAIGWKHFERPITGMAMAACYLLLPYTRMALVDSGQLDRLGSDRRALFWHSRPCPDGTPDRSGLRMDSCVPGPDPPLARILLGTRRMAVPYRRGDRRGRMCLDGEDAPPRPGRVGTRLGCPEYRRCRPLAGV